MPESTKPALTVISEKNMRVSHGALYMGGDDCFYIPCVDMPRGMCVQQEIYDRTQVRSEIGVRDGLCHTMVAGKHMPLIREHFAVTEETDYIMIRDAMLHARPRSPEKVPASTLDPSPAYVVAASGGFKLPGLGRVKRFLGATNDY